MKNPNAIVPPGSMAARNCFNFARLVVENGEDYVIPAERVIKTESPAGKLIPTLAEVPTQKPHHKDKITVQETKKTVIPRGWRPKGSGSGIGNSVPRENV